MAERDAKDECRVPFLVLRLQINPFPRRLIWQIQFGCPSLFPRVSQRVWIVERRGSEREASLNRGILGCTEGRVDGEGEEPFEGIGVSGRGGT